jgi:mRNA-degrading endonuclease toxin of MazEF toxin-antitoxin module
MIVVLLSASASKGHRGRSVIRIPPCSAGLDRSGFALCHQVTTLDRSRLVTRIGSLEPERPGQFEDGLRAAPDLE